jgi:hypothetical protein
MKNPWLWFGLYYAFSAFVSGMPAPDTKSGNGYRWAYGSLHTLAGNLTQVRGLLQNGNSSKPTDPQA